jgi:glycosyltransferase involved in cell wall biosynthesis
MKKISIITATYNSAKTISDTLNSIINQSYPNIEILIIDGKSNDNTLDVINSIKHKKKIRIFSEPDKGIYDALNKGIQLATGDVIGFVHSDDMLASNQIISKIANQLEKGNIDGVYGDLQYVDKNNTDKVIRYWKSYNFKTSLLKKGWMPAHPTLFLKKEVYIKHGNFNLNYEIAADYDFMLRVFKDSTMNFIYLSELIMKMRIGGASNKNLKNIIQKTKEDYKAITSNKTGNLVTLFLKNYTKFKQFY